MGDPEAFLMLMLTIGYSKLLPYFRCSARNWWYVSLRICAALRWLYFACVSS